ncbi:MAG TPA: glycosyltransferase family 2 protein [Acidimicrobiales bacterium]|nr:glycosyltransferase family 2 protein [Acidimicrobiales bacterium]
MDADDTPTPESDDHITLASRAEAFAELADLNDDAPTGDSARSDATGGGDGDDPPVVPDVEAAPPVVAVVVVHNAGDWLDELLVSLGNQNYENLSVLVIDAASDIDPTPRVARILPGAFVRRLESNVGYGPTINEILELVSGASFYCFCHDDVALDADAVHELVSEAFRSNAGIVGPKLVDWDDPDLLLSVGFTVDRSAGRAPYAEHHELDQGQHDAVRDVFAVSGGCTLIRSDLFAHLGGFDPGIDLLGEDLDLCWRAHLVGARVVVAPRARVRHRQALAARVDATGLVRVDAAHRLRTVLSNYRLGHLLLLVPQLLVVSVVEAVIEATIGRREHARAQLRAWGTNLRSVRSILRSRRGVRAIRERNDRSIAQLQTKTWARLDGLIQANRRARAEEVLTAGEFDTADEFDEATLDGGRDAHLGAEVDDDERDSFVRTGAPRRSYSLVSWGIAAVIAVVLIGSRELFLGPLPAIGSFAGPPGSVADLWRTWLGSWNPSGLGSAQSPSAGLAPMALVGTIFGGAFGFVRRVAILLPIPLGLFGAWRLARPLGSRRAQLVSLILYAVVPVPWNGLAHGAWGGLLIYGIAPWLLYTLIRSMRVAPFTDRAGRGGDASPPRWWPPVLGFGLLLAVTGALVPSVAAVAVVVVVGLLVGSVLVGRFAGLGRLVLTTLGAVAVAAVLLLPWTFVGPGRSGWVLAGMGGGSHGWLGLDEILRFQSGPMGAGVLGYAVLLAATLPLLIGRGWRFAWGVRAWTVAGACFTVVWLGQQSWFGFPVPAPEVFLAPGAAALALSVACGAAAFEMDLPTFRFGGAQVASAVATVALVLATFPMLGNATDGRWKMAPVGLDQALDFVSTQRNAQPFRVLWVADPAVMPVAGWHLDDHSNVGVTNHGMATMDELWAPADAGRSGSIGDALELATGSETTRLGRILADMGIRYIVLPRQNVPLPYRSAAHPPPARLLAALDDQLDLARVSANDAVVVYRNEAWSRGHKLYPTDMPTGTSVGDALDAPDGRRVPGSVDPTGASRFTVPEAGILATGQPADASWRLRLDGTAAEPVTLWGWEQGFVVPRAGKATLTRSGGLQRPIVLGLVGLAWVGALAGWILGRRRRAEDTLVDVPATDEAGGAGSLVRLGTGGAPAGAVEVSEVRVGDDADPLTAESPDAEQVTAETPAAESPTVDAEEDDR